MKEMNSYLRMWVILCSLPHSNAQCERVFSQINLIKTRTRNRLITSTVNGLLLTKQMVKYLENCTKFDVTREMRQKMTKNHLYKSIAKTGQVQEEEETVDLVFEDCD
jgi:5S rRNA maturation endonuclease (ribonuclease M5)